MPESLPQATTEPVNATAPIAIVSPRVMSVNASVLVASVDIYWAIATSKEERPPKPLKRATSSGIPVISTFFDQTAPITPPTNIAKTI